MHACLFCLEKKILVNIYLDNNICSLHKNVCVCAEILAYLYNDNIQ